jgi:hypothetical protein
MNNVLAKSEKGKGKEKGRGAVRTLPAYGDRFRYIFTCVAVDE